MESGVAAQYFKQIKSRRNVVSSSILSKWLIFYVAIRNQDGVAMPSVDGELVIILVTRDGLFQAQKPVALQNAMALFF